MSQAAKRLSQVRRDFERLAADDAEDLGAVLNIRQAQLAIVAWAAMISVRRVPCWT